MPIAIFDMLIDATLRRGPSEKTGCSNSHRKTLDPPDHGTNDTGGSHNEGIMCCEPRRLTRDSQSVPLTTPFVHVDRGVVPIN